MRRWYVVFSRDVTATAARKLLKQWGARPEGGQPETPLDGGDLCLAVEGPNDLQERVKGVPGVEVFDNEYRPGLYR